jgi:hypothetical protein
MRETALKFLSIPLILGMIGCQKTPTSQDVRMGTAQIQCSTARCQSHNSGSYDAYVFVTASGCSTIGYDLKASGATTVTCGGGTCAGSISQWVDTTGATNPVFSQGSYSICTAIYFNGPAPIPPADHLSDAGNTVTRTQSYAFVQGTNSFRVTLSTDL